MSIIKPKLKSQKVTIRLKIDDDVLQEIKQYCAYAGFRKQDDFFEEAAVYILSKDREFKEIKDNKIGQVEAA